MVMELNSTNVLKRAEQVGEGKHIIFFLVGKSPTGKTNIYWVQAKDKDDTTTIHEVIGQINWYSAWYQYSFFPQKDCVFEKNCLRDIANFCEEETKKHRLSIQHK